MRRHSSSHSLARRSLREVGSSILEYDDGEEDEDDSRIRPQLSPEPPWSRILRVMHRHDISHYRHAHVFHYSGLQAEKKTMRVVWLTGTTGATNDSVSLTMELSVARNAAASSSAVFAV